jgi:hypothetical protein
VTAEVAVRGGDRAVSTFDPAEGVLRVPTQVSGVFLTFTPDQKVLNDAQMVLLAPLGIEAGWDPRQVAVFLMECQERGMDPWQREAYLMLYPGGKYIRHVGIDGFRSRGESTGEYRGRTTPLFCDEDERWREIWPYRDRPPFAAKVGIIRVGFDAPVYAVAHYDEYVPMQDEKVWQPKAGGGGNERVRTGKKVPGENWRVAAEGGKPTVMIGKCFDEATEVLTDQGFQPFSEATGRILQVTANGLEPTDAQPYAQSYGGDMVTLDSDDLNFSVTPNHDMVTTHGKVSAGDLYEGARSRPKYWIPRAAPGSAPEAVAKDETLAVAAAYLSDGSDIQGGFRIEVSRPRKVAALREIGLYRDERVRRVAGDVAHGNGRDITTRSDRRQFVYGPTVLPDWVRPGKFVDIGGVLALSKRQARVFVDSLIGFDGHVSARGVRRFYTSRPDHAAMFEVAAVAAGYSINKPALRVSDISDKPNFIFTISERSEIPLIRWGRGDDGRSRNNATGRTGLVLTTNTSGRVWCVTVPSGVIVVRRNGFSMQCGNCAEAQAWRAAFPRRFGGFYAPEEMERVRAEAKVDDPAAAKRRAAYEAEQIAVVAEERTPEPELTDADRELLLAELDEQAEVLGKTVADLCSRWTASRDGREISTATPAELADHVHRIRPYVLEALREQNRDDEATIYEKAPAAASIHDLFGRGPAIPEPPDGATT